MQSFFLPKPKAADIEKVGKLCDQLFAIFKIKFLPNFQKDNTVLFYPAKNILPSAKVEDESVASLLGQAFCNSEDVEYSWDVQDEFAYPILKGTPEAIQTVIDKFSVCKQVHLVFNKQFELDCEIKSTNPFILSFAHPLDEKHGLYSLCRKNFFNPTLLIGDPHKLLGKLNNYFERKQNDGIDEAQKAFNEDIDNADISHPCERIEAHIMRGADVTKFRNEFHESALLKNIKFQNYPELLKLLIRHKANVNAAIYYDTVPLSIAIEEGKVECVKVLLEAGANQQNPENTIHPSALHRALYVEKPNLDILTLLIEHKADVNDQDCTGFSPLHQAALRQNKECFEFLLEKKADLSLKDIREWTPMDYFNPEVQDLEQQPPQDGARISSPGS